MTSDLPTESPREDNNMPAASALDTYAHLRVVPIDKDDADRFIRMHHRHHKPPEVVYFSTAVANGDQIVAVAMGGRPMARAWCDGWTVEIVRSCTDQTPNANSKVVAAARRIALDHGYRRVITYTQANESGASLRGAGFRVIAIRKPRAGWDNPGRPRVNGAANANVERIVWGDGDIPESWVQVSA